MKKINLKLIEEKTTLHSIDGADGSESAISGCSISARFSRCSCGGCAGRCIRSNRTHTRFHGKFVQLGNDVLAIRVFPQRIHVWSDLL